MVDQKCRKKKNLGGASPSKRGKSQRTQGGGGGVLATFSGKGWGEGGKKAFPRNQIKYKKGVPPPSGLYQGGEGMRKRKKQMKKGSVHQRQKTLYETTNRGW